MKRTVSLLLCAVFLLVLLSPAALGNEAVAAASGEAAAAADMLCALGLFVGTGADENGNPDYDLDRVPTRNEAVTMLVRLLGKETAARAGSWDTPFTDLGWAALYVGYAYAQGLTKGVDAVSFGGDRPVKATEYITFLLRALGYESGTDFDSAVAWVLSDKLGITHGEYGEANSGDFLRADMVLLSAAALTANLKGSALTLADRLISDGAFTRSQYDAVSPATIPGWVADSDAMRSIVEFVRASADESSAGYIPKADRIAVFDMDGTLYGERFPTYFNDWLFIWRALYDDSYEAPEELKEFARAWEDKVLRGIPIEDFDALERELGPQLYEGLTDEAYAEVVRRFKELPVWGFEGMTYGEAYFQPMVALVKYLHDHDYSVFIVSATYRDAVRIMTEGVLDEWIPADRVIGTDLLYVASGDEAEESMFYELEPQDELVIAGELFIKNQKTNKAVVIQQEIGKKPVLAFGNSTGDFSMATYTLQNAQYGGRAYMLLCDDTLRDYGDPAATAAFKEKCDARGFRTVSMKDEFAVLYPAGAEMKPAAAQDRVEVILKSMSLRDKLAQMMFFCPRTQNGEKVTVLSEDQSQYIAEHRFGGILLFGENFADAEQTLRLVTDLQNATVEGGGIAPFVAADQEGGYVARLSFGTTGVGNMALAATGDPGCARDMAQIYGEELGLLGLNVDFAPVMDVNDNAANPVIGVRSFSDDAETVGTFGVAYMEGLHTAGTAACLKHFPGHGNTATDSHTGLPLVDRSHDELMENELVPFKAAIDAGADMVMTAHIQYPQVEVETYPSAATGEEIYLPATMSRTILTDILRDELGFEGVIVSDALDMQAIWANFSRDDMLALSINAGVNMLILPGSWDMWALSDELLARAVALTEEGVIDLARVDDSVRRILTLKAKYGLLEKDAAAVTEEAVRAAVEGCGSAEHRQAAWDIAVKALTLLKNENSAFPMNVQPGERTLILFSAASRAGAGELSRQILEEMGALPEGAEIVSMAVEPDTAEACEAAARTADHVLIVSRSWDIGCLDPATEDGFPVGVLNRVIGELHEAGKMAIVVSAQLPYDIACYPEADAILLCYCSSLMRSVPAASGAGSAWAPNLPAAICAAFGVGTPSGILPVDLPALDGDFHLTDVILYPRQTPETAVSAFPTAA